MNATPTDVVGAHARLTPVTFSTIDESVIDHLWATVADLPMPIALFGLPEDRILRANDGFVQLAALDRGTDRGTQYSTLVRAEEGHLEGPVLDELLRGERRTYRIERHLLRPDGSETLIVDRVWVPSAALCPECRAPDGAPLVLFRAIGDLSTRQGIEAQLQRSLEQLAHQKEDLARSNAELEEFAYVVSHDLREPLRGITGFSRLLERELGENLSPKVAQYLDFVIGSAGRMETLINDLLTYSRVGRGSPAPEAVALHDVLEEVDAQLHVAIAEAGVQVERTRELPTVWANHRELSQLIQNLVGNALKYRSTEPGGRIRITADPAPEDGWIEVRVDDDGIGIEPEYREHVFGVFERLHARTEYSGSGIGLAVCQKIVQRSGGRIWVEDSDLGGSSFRFTVPAARPDPTDVSPQG